MEKKNITKAHKIAKKIIAKKKMNEGFNNRHGLSENASAEKQAVAEQTGMPVSGVKNSSWFSRQTDMQRATQNLSKMSRLRKLRANPTALDTKRNAELDKPGLEKSGVATALKDPKAREVLAQTTKDAANFAVPSALTGGPLGAAIGRTALGGLTQAGKLINRFRGNSSQPQPNLAAGAARRTNQSVPQVTSTPGSATGRFSASGPFGSIRDASKVTRRGGDARASGGPSGTMTSAARLQAIRRPSSGNNPPAATTAAARPATSSSQLSQAVARSKALRPQKGPADVSKSLTSNQPPSAAAATGPEKIKTSTQTTTTQPDYDKMSFGQAFKAARQQAGGAGGKFKYKGKEYQTNVQGTGTAKKPQEKYQAASKLKTVAPAPETKTTTSVVGGQGIAAVPGGASSAAAKPSPSAAKERANFAGPPSGTSSLTRRVGPDGQGGIKVGQNKPSMGMSFTPQTNVDTAKKPAASVTPQMSQSVSSLQQKASMAGKERGLAPDFAKKELTRRQNIQTAKGA